MRPLPHSTAHRPFEPARQALERSWFRRQVRAVLSGKALTLRLDPASRGIDQAAVLVETAAGVSPGSADFEILSAALQRSGSLRLVIDGLGSRDPFIRARCARIAGFMRMEEAVPMIAWLMWSREAPVRSRAAHALGRIGGVRSANALLHAIQRLGPRPMLIVALAHAAPDLYLETILSAGQPRAVQPAVALAAGLRGRWSAVAPLLGQLEGGSSGFRIVGCRAIGWSGNPAAVPVLTSYLLHRDWRVRASAAKALGALGSREQVPALQVCVADRHPSVRKSATSALRRLGRRADSGRSKT